MLNKKVFDPFRTVVSFKTVCSNFNNEIDLQRLAAGKEKKGKEKKRHSSSSSAIM